MVSEALAQPFHRCHLGRGLGARTNFTEGESMNVGLRAAHGAKTQDPHFAGLCFSRTGLLCCLRPETATCLRHQNRELKATFAQSEHLVLALAPEGSDNAT